MTDPQIDIAIVGGGPAGSTVALYLAQMNFRVCVIEKKDFPRETLCGEFLSREVSQILGELHLSEGFHLLHPNPLTSFRFCTEYSQSYTTELPFTAYGLKRGVFDSFLLDNARKAGALIYQPKTVEAIHHTEGAYNVALAVPGGTENITARHVIVAHGKSLSLDKTLHRTYRKSRSRLNGIKFHVHKKYLPNVPQHEIQIYTGRNMYCGVNVVNDDTVTLCFLEERSPNDIQPRAKITELLKANQYFAQAISGDFENMLSSFPIYGSGDIYFGKKNLVEDGIFMIGDAAQVIAPLAGDGIGMAMESAKIIASVLDEGRRKALNCDALSSLYTKRWRSSFQRRLRIAKEIQQVLLSRLGKKVSGLALAGFPSLLSRTIEFTRG
ncbi:MAG: NAD(P)/FAD-dependent oxidoreductase [Bacteroidota bacterium]